MSLFCIRLISIQQVFRAHTGIHIGKILLVLPSWFGNNNLSRQQLTLSSRNWWTAAVCHRVLWLTINQSCCLEIWHTLTCSGEECGGPCQVAGVMDGAKEAGARRSTQELRLEAKVQLVRVDLHLLLEDAIPTERNTCKTTLHNTPLGIIFYLRK